MTNELFKGVNFNAQLPLITLKTSAGKSTLAIKELRSIIEETAGHSFKKIFLTSPYSRTSKQSLEDERFSNDVRELNDELVNSAEFDSRIDETIICTYERLSRYLASGEIDLEGCICVIDEIPTLLEMSCYCDGLSYLIEYLLDEKLFRKCCFVGLSGTPDLIFNYANKLQIPFEFVDLTPQSPVILKAKHGKVIIKGSAKTYCQKLIKDGFSGCLLVYVQGVADCFNLKKLFDENGLNAAFVISQHNKYVNPQTKHYYTDDMKQQIYDDLNILEWLDGKSTIPNDLDALIINASVREGVNIMSENVSAVIVQSTSKADVEQVRGRARKKLIDELTVIYSTEYENRTIKNWSNANLFFQELRESADPQTLMKNRLIAQVKADKESNEFVSSRNFAILADSKIPRGKPQTLDYCVLEGKRLFVNWFALAYVEYSLDNYHICETKSYFDKSTGESVTERTEYFRGNEKRPDLVEFFKPLNNLLVDGEEFEFIKGAEISTELVNNSRIDLDNIKKTLGLKEGITKRYTSKEMREYSKVFKPVNSDYKVRSTPTLVKYLEKYCTVEKRYPRINGKQTTCYYLTLK